ncbi:Scr1 family TA system antitoxin-like transcriptional regulator, partial [Streptomyces sp. NPDC048845]
YRKRRQEIFYRPRPTPYEGFVHEAALRMQFGGTAMQRGLIAHR